MVVDLPLPQLGVEMDSALLVEWSVEEGERVTAGQVVATVETDKVQAELEAPTDGVIGQRAEVDVEYRVGDRLAVIAEDEAELGSAPPGDRSSPDASAEAETTPATEVTTSHTPERTGSGGSDPTSQRRAATERRRDEPLASPVARRMAASLGIDLGGVEPSGSRGVIRKRDVERAHADASAAAPPTPDASSQATVGGADRREKLSATRRTIASRMHGSLRDTAQMTDVREHDVTALVALRTRAAASADTVGFRLSFTDLFIKAAAIALREVPELNASLDDDALITFGSIGIGVAVAVPDGLMVPVVHEPDQLSMAALHERLTARIERARTRRSTAEDLAGGTFTITNFGSYGTHFGTPILVPGQVGILGFGAMIERPMVRRGEMVVGTAMYTSLTVDHQVIDGETAGRFQSVLGSLFADPDALLLR